MGMIDDALGHSNLSMLLLPLEAFSVPKYFDGERPNRSAL
jgi:hypothetical protein